LSLEESRWRFKIQTIWLKEGDNNKRYFERYVQHWNNQNTTREIKDRNGTMVTSHEDIVEIGKDF
jgi:hypothetical protein